VSALAAVFKFWSIQGEAVRMAREEGAGADAIEGSVKLYDAMTLRRLLLERRPARILEVGSFLGLSARWILEVTRPWGATLTAVDPNVAHRGFARPLDAARRLNREFLPSRLEFVERRFGPEAAAEDPRLKRPFDFVFIDGDHRYEAVRSDFETASALLSPGGTITFHDAMSSDSVWRLLGEIGSQGVVRVHGARLAGPGTFRAVRRSGLASLVRRLNLRAVLMDGIGEFRRS
jgi:predicted O-methyltransferase YrrM